MTTTVHKGAPDPEVLDRVVGGLPRSLREWLMPDWWLPPDYQMRGVAWSSKMVVECVARDRLFSNATSFSNHALALTPGMVRWEHDRLVAGIDQLVASEFGGQHRGPTTVVWMPVWSLDGSGK
jgi:hypothetical protein